MRRRVYAPSGELRYDSTWSSRYEAEPALVRAGTKKRPKAKPAEPARAEPGATAGLPAADPPP